MPDPADLPALERAIWHAATHYDPTFMARTLAPDFVEFGRAGRLYPRAELLAAPNVAEGVETVLHDVAVRPLSATIALVTCVSEVRYPSRTEWSLRSTLWDCASGSWQARFHQGTPCEAKT